MEGTFIDKEAASRVGEFIYYYENGNKKSSENYVKSKMIGKHTSWYENGNKELEGEYTENQDAIFNELKINQFWQENNIQTVTDGNGYCEIKTKKTVEKGNIKNGLRDGIWSGNNGIVNFSYTENYENGKLTSGISIDSENKEHKYDIVEHRPKPKKGFEDFYKYIGKNFKTTREADKNNIAGRLIATFIIEKDANIVDIKIVKSLGYGLDEELIRVLNNSPEWIPGEMRGIKVRVLFSIPITVQSSR